jgi:Domain of unknown function (DUF4397)
MRTVAGIAAGTILLLVPAGQAFAATKVNFVHAVPGAGDATLRVSGGAGSSASLSGVGFGEASKYSSGPSGKVTITLTVGGKKAAGSTETLADRTGYTVIAEPNKAGKVVLIAYRAGEASAGSASVRGAHGAAELPEADFMVGKKSIGTLSLGEDGDYANVEPGSYEVMATRPGSDDAVVSQDGVNFAAGTASTVYAVGSGGERARFVVVQDGVDAPEGGPATGLGGLSGDDGAPWIAALLAALAAGALGGLAFTRAVRRGPHA